jgi:hypothetical protein
MAYGAAAENYPVAQPSTISLNIAFKGSWMRIFTSRTARAAAFARLR